MYMYSTYDKPHVDYSAKGTIVITASVSHPDWGRVNPPRSNVRAPIGLCTNSRARETGEKLLIKKPFDEEE